MRHEFMEFIVRIAEEKYRKSLLGISYFEAIQKYFKLHLEKEINKKEKYDASIWRYEKLW